MAASHAQTEGIQELRALPPGRLAALTPPKLSGMMAIDRSQWGLWARFWGVGFT